ncbi:hypothetical protein DJ021_15260 [Phenylobacterium hankyongense]|uniref:HicB-like antitoxin of toxin-antitoxin system domain-containing protein n=1 Tax=Phenylobacterium hankyongense TaxID=1813876 RepID=A0A328B3W3_9CAUL|nr:type II toxin-antitoxin system HicB family antitoxin [Phenylobacterium hankyongense]RAK61071.1 hypothetical protein DJ021_15260 [Phenylobacterium hankyongense]
MSTVLYVAVASGDQTLGYQAVVPDLPGCSAAGADLGELLGNARQTVGAHLQSLADAGQEWPRPTPIEQIQVPPSAVAVLVDVEVEDTPVRVNISIGEQLLKRLDAAAELRGASRSGFIAQAVRISLGDKGRGAGAEFESATRRLQEELSAVGRKINESLGPDSPFSRSMADLDERVTDTVRKAADSVSAAMARRKEADARAAKAEHAGAPERAESPEREGADL